MGSSPIGSSNFFSLFTIILYNFLYLLEYMGTLDKKQQILLSELKDNIQFYKEELRDQVRYSKLFIYIFIGAAIGVGLFLVLNPEFLTKLQQISSNMDTVASLIGESVPITFATKSFNASKFTSKKINGLRIFERDVNRMEHDIIPNSVEHILSLETELERYIIS